MRKRNNKIHLNNYGVLGGEGVAFNIDFYLFSCILLIERGDFLEI